MAKLDPVQGTTSMTVDFFVADSSSTTGAGLTGLVIVDGNHLGNGYARDVDERRIHRGKLYKCAGMVSVGHPERGTRSGRDVSKDYAQGRVEHGSRQYRVATSRRKQSRCGAVRPVRVAEWPDDVQEESGADGLPARDALLDGPHYADSGADDYRDALD